MKKNLMLLILLTACVAVHAQLNRVAVISIYGNRNLSENPMEKAMNEALLKDSSFNVAPAVEKFADIINTEFLKEFPFPFMAKDSVQNAPGYKDLIKLTYAKGDPKAFNMYEGGMVNAYAVAKGYIPIASFGILDDTKAIQKAFEILPKDIDGVMIAYLTFNLVDEFGAFGITTKKVQAYANIKIFNREGKRIFKLKTSEKSNGGMTAVGGFVVETSKIMPHIKSATENLLETMHKKMAKSLAKLAKKIAKDKED